MSIAFFGPPFVMTISLFATARTAPTPRRAIAARRPGFAP